jgi:NTP pyrophosphatase (non-canonical NTP hydrolase)
LANEELHAGTLIRVGLPAGGVGRLMISRSTSQLAVDVHARRAPPNVGPKGSDDDIRFLALAMAGEAGEAANIVKKAWRDGTPLDREKLAEEIAGTASYLISLPASIDLDLDAEVVKQIAALEARYASAI